MPTISYPITLDTVDYKRDLPKIQGVSPAALTGAGGRSDKHTYTLASNPVLFNNPDIAPLAPVIGSLTDFEFVASLPSSEIGRNLLLQAGSFVPISNASYPDSLASGMAFAGMRPVGDNTIAITLPTSLLTAGASVSARSARVRIFCSLDSSDWPNLVVESDTGASYMYPLPNNLPFFIFNFAVTAPGGSVVPTRRVKYTANSNLTVVPGGGSGSSLQLTAILYTRPYRDHYTEQQVTDSIEIIYTLADPISKVSSTFRGYNFEVSDIEQCNGIDTVEIKANLSWSQSLSSIYHKTYQLSTILPGGIPYEYYCTNTSLSSIKRKVTQFLENAGKWTTTFTDPYATQDDMKTAQFMSLLLAGEPTMAYPTGEKYLFDELSSDLYGDYDRLSSYGLCHIHPCTEFNPEGLFYTPVFKSSGGYDSVLQDVTTVSFTADYFGVPGKPSIFSSSPVVYGRYVFNDEIYGQVYWNTTWCYSAESNALLPGVGATGAYGSSNSGGNTPYLSSSYFEQAGPAAIVINF